MYDKDNNYDNNYESDHRHDPISEEMLKQTTRGLQRRRTKIIQREKSDETKSNRLLAFIGHRKRKMLSNRRTKSENKESNTGQFVNKNNRRHSLCSFFHLHVLFFIFFFHLF